jgi:outer membrane protein assembly factor BamB
MILRMPAAICAACVLLILPAAALDVSSWPMQRGDPAGTAAVTLPAPSAPLRAWTFSGRPAQVYEPGVPTWGSPAFAVVEGQPCVFIGGHDQTLHALDLATQQCRWSRITNGSILDAPCVAVVRNVPTVFWGSSDRFVYAHAATDGALLWTRELALPSNTQGSMRIPAPMCDGETLFVAWFVNDKALARSSQDAALAALDAATGRLLWQRPLTHGPVNAPMAATLGGQQYLFVPARKGLLQAFAVSRAGATPAWSFQMPHEVLGSPVISTNGQPALFLGSKFGDLVAIDALAGTQLWHRMTGNWVDNNACCGRAGEQAAVFVGSHDYSLYALQAETGAVLWRRPLGGEVYSAPCYFTAQGRQFVAVACLDDRLYVVEADTGRVAGCFQVGRPTWDKVPKGQVLWSSPIAVASGGDAVLVHGGYDGNIYVLPLTGATPFRAHPREAAGLWTGMLLVAVLFCGVILPILVRGK